MVPVCVQSYSETRYNPAEAPQEAVPAPAPKLQVEAEASATDAKFAQVSVVEAEFLKPLIPSSTLVSHLGQFVAEGEVASRLPPGVKTREAVWPDPAALGVPPLGAASKLPSWVDCLKIIFTPRGPEGRPVVVEVGVEVKLLAVLEREVAVLIGLGDPSGSSQPTRNKAKKLKPKVRIQILLCKKSLPFRRNSGAKIQSFQSILFKP